MIPLVASSEERDFSKHSTLTLAPYYHAARRVFSRSQANASANLQFQLKFCYKSHCLRHFVIVTKMEQKEWRAGPKKRNPSLENQLPNDEGFSWSKH